MWELIWTEGLRVGVALRTFFPPLNGGCRRHRACRLSFGLRATSHHQIVHLQTIGPTEQLFEGVSNQPL